MTDDPGEERGALWSPDGRSLSYYLSGTGTRDGLYVIPKDQSGRWGLPRRVWNHPSRSSAAVAASGVSWLIVNSAR